MDKASRWLFSNSSLSGKEESLSVNSNHPSKNVHRQTIVTSILSGKGGVGKTSTTLKMAHILGTQGYKCLVIDCDYNLSNTSIKLGIAPNDNFYQLICYQKNFHECLIKLPCFDLLPTCNGNLSLFQENFPIDEIIIHVINDQRKNYDFIFLDSPGGTSKDSMNLAAYCDHRLFIVAPDKSSITDSYSVMKILSTHYGIKNNHLIVNMIDNLVQYNRVVKTMSETAENFLKVRTKILGGIPKLSFGDKNFDEIFHGEKNDTHDLVVKLSLRFADDVKVTVENRFYDKNQVQPQQYVRDLA